MFWFDPCILLTHPFSHGLWLWVMLLSTLVPTVLHVIAALASPFAMAFRPAVVVRDLVAQHREFDEEVLGRARDGDAPAMALVPILSPDPLAKLTRFRAVERRLFLLAGVVLASGLILSAVWLFSAGISQALPRLLLILIGGSDAARACFS